MEYPPHDGERFVKLQWDAIHAPGFVIGLFEADEDAMAKDDEKRLYQILYTIGTDAFVFCKQCESESVVTQDEYKFIIKGQTFKCSYGQILPDGRIEARYITEQADMDGKIQIGNISTKKEQFIISLKKDQTVQLCDANEDYAGYCSMNQPFTNDSFNQKVLRDLSRCAELPDISKYRVNRTFTPSSSSAFEKIKEAVAAKLTHSFFGEVKLCIDLTSSEGDYERLLTPGLTDYAPAEIKLGIHMDYAAGKVWLNMDVRDNYLQEYTGKWQAKTQQYEMYWDSAVDIEDLRRQVISDLEDIQTVQSFFDNLVQSANALISDKIAGFVEGVLVSQKIAKNVWDEGNINRSTWHSRESEHNQWPEYAQFNPFVGGAADGFIGEIVGIPVAIKGIYGIMTDREQQQAMLAMFSKEGISQLTGMLKSEAEATMNDNERLEHFSAQTVIEVATMFSGMGVTQIGKMAELAETATEGLGALGKVKNLRKKIDDLVNKSQHLEPIKKMMKDFFRGLEPAIVEKLIKIDNFDEVLKDMAQGWRKFYGERFVFEHLSGQSDEFIAGISKFEARIDDVANFTADIKLKPDLLHPGGLSLEYKSWKKNTFEKLMKGDQFKNQLKNYIKDGDFQYIIDRKKLLNDGVLDPDAFVKGEFQKVFKANNYELFEDVYNSPKMKELLFDNNPNRVIAKNQFIELIDNTDELLFRFIKIE
jgi:hypothetical protein